MRALAFIVMAALTGLGCGVLGNNNGSSKNKTPGVNVDCTQPQNACDDWSPAASPFDGTYTQHACTAWRDADGFTLHASNATSCKVAADAPEGKKVDLLAACPMANRVGGCLVATESSCEIQFVYADPSVIESRRPKAADIEALCISIGATYVK